MPLFEYRCTACEHLEEVLQKHGEPPPEVCPHCGKPLARPVDNAKGSPEAPLARMTSDKFDLLILADGGGVAGQAGAARLGISRALVEFNAELRGRLKKLGFLTRDPRKHERKKYGQKGARKRFQFSKR